MAYNDPNHSTKGNTMSRSRTAPRYGFWKFVGDVFMTCLTAGFWLIWVFIREMRYASR